MGDVSTDLAPRPALPTFRPGTPAHRAATLVRYNPAPAHRPPRLVALAAATVVALAGSIAADWVVAHVVPAIVASTKGYDHFNARDYVPLTVIGVLAACAGWPIVARACAAPRWLFTRLAVAVSAVLLLPDVAIWVQGQPAAGVIGLMVMHVAIGVVTYLALTRLAPERA